jgi:ferredoxin
MSIFNSFKRDSVNKEDNKDKVLIIKKQRCPENHACPSIRVCPVNALKQKGYAAPTVNMDLCIKCGKCVKFCPMRAIVLE